MSRYLTVEEVAEALGVSASWVYKHKDLLVASGSGSASGGSPSRNSRRCWLNQPEDRRGRSWRMPTAVGPDKSRPVAAGASTSESRIPIPMQRRCGSAVQRLVPPTLEPSPLDQPSISL